jgi:hypothetical protein
MASPIDEYTRVAVACCRGRRHEAAIALWSARLAERLWHKGRTGAQA